jgi:predicted acetyltransferase
MSELKIERVKLSDYSWRVQLYEDDERVAGLWLHIMKMRIGSVPVSMAGIGGVATSEKHRNKGYASIVMWDSIALMEEKDWEFSLLFGIPDFYHRFGFGSVFPDSELVVETEVLALAGRPVSIRAFKKADAPSLRRLYARLSAQRTGSAARRSGWTYFDRAAHYSRPGKTLLSVDGKGRVTGYATWNVDERRERRFNVSEIVGKSPEIHTALASAVGKEAKRAGCEQVRFYVPPDDPFGEFCSRFGCGWEIFYSRNAGAMGRIVQLDRLFSKLESELRRRWAASDLRYTDTISLVTDIGTVGLRIQGRKLSVTERLAKGSVRVKMPQLKLAQLVTGYRDVEDLSFDEDVSAPRRTHAALDVLFPKQQGYMWWSDRF